MDRGQRSVNAGSSNRQANAVARQFDELAERYVAKYQKPTNILALEKVRRMELLCEHAGQLQPQWVLEAGSGPGLALSALREQLPSATLCGVDISYEMLRRAGESGLPGVLLGQSLVEQLPFADEAFELVYALGVVDYVKCPREFMRSVWRVLRPNGVFVFTYPNADSMNRRFRTWLSRMRNRSGVGVSARPLRGAVVDAIASESGFAIESREFITYGNGLITFPWTVGLSLGLERWLRHVNAVSSRLAWSCLCVARKR